MWVDAWVNVGECGWMWVDMWVDAGVIGSRQCLQVMW